MVALAEFLVAGNSLLTLAKLGHEQDEESWGLLFMITVGALSATAKILPRLQRLGWFTTLEEDLADQTEASRKDHAERLNRIRIHLLGEGEEESPLRKLLRRVRNKAAYHWDPR